jgi:N-methylhydantoinase A/oxoprolinase/acetone carboxylase beta subunit
VRDVWFSSATKTSIYDRKSLYPGARIAGPAVIQELSSATIVPPGASVTVDPQENILLELQ